MTTANRDDLQRSNLPRFRDAANFFTLFAIFPLTTAQFPAILMASIRQGAAVANPTAARQASVESSVMATATATATAPATVTVTAPVVLTKSISTFLKAEAAVGKAWEGMFTSLREAADENKWTEKEQRQIALDLSFKEALKAYAEKEGYTGDQLATVVETRFTAKAPDRAKIMILAFPKCPVAEQDRAREAGMGINDLLTLSRKADNTVETVKAEKAAKAVKKAADTIASAGSSPAAAGTPTGTTAASLTPEEKFDVVLANVIVAARKDGLLNAAIINKLLAAVENCRKLDAGR